MSFFDIRNLLNVDFFLIQNAFRKPGIQYFLGNFSGRFSQAHDQYIRVVPPACPARRFSVAAQCRSYPLHLVCGDRRSCKYVFSSLATAIFIAAPPLPHPAQCRHANRPSSTVHRRFQSFIPPLFPSSILPTFLSSTSSTSRSYCACNPSQNSGEVLK
jgi:hypothetical protein